MNDDSFWDDFTFSAESDMDRMIQGHDMDGEHFKSVRNALWDTGETVEQFSTVDGGVDLPVTAGTRVAFHYANLDALLTYPQVPAEGVEGTVVTVKAANGKGTYADTGHVFVKWDDGRFMPVLAGHLLRATGSKRVARGVSVRVADLGSLSNFFVASASSSDELVHKATKDLWSFRQDDGGYVIERLFDFNGDPLKV